MRIASLALYSLTLRQRSDKGTSTSSFTICSASIPFLRNSNTTRPAISRAYAYSLNLPSGERLPGVFAPWPLSINTFIYFSPFFKINNHLVADVYHTLSHHSASFQLLSISIPSRDVYESHPNVPPVLAEVQHK